MAVQYHMVHMKLNCIGHPMKQVLSVTSKNSLLVVVYHYVDDINMVAVICTLFIVLQILCNLILAVWEKV